MIRGIVLGFLLAVVVLGGGFYYYFASGMAPAASSDAAMPFEKKLAHLALDAHIGKQKLGEPPVPADERNFLDGVRIYKQQCEVCHGVAGHPSEYEKTMYPRPPQLFTGKGVSDDPASETYWKVINGIRLTGMPAFKSDISDTEAWQVSQLLAHSDQLPDSVRQALVSDSVQPAALPAGKRAEK